MVSASYGRRSRRSPPCDRPVVSAAGWSTGGRLPFGRTAGSCEMFQPARLPGWNKVRCREAAQTRASWHGDDLPAARDLAVLSLDDLHGRSGRGPGRGVRAADHLVADGGHPADPACARTPAGTATRPACPTARRGGVPRPRADPGHRPAGRGGGLPRGRSSPPRGQPEQSHPDAGAVARPARLRAPPSTTSSPPASWSSTRPACCPTPTSGRSAPTTCWRAAGRRTQPGSDPAGPRTVISPRQLDCDRGRRNAAASRSAWACPSRTAYRAMTGSMRCSASGRRPQPARSHPGSSCVQRPSPAGEPGRVSGDRGPGPVDPARDDLPSGGTGRCSAIRGHCSTPVSTTGASLEAGAAEALLAATEADGFTLAPRLTVRPEYARRCDEWIDPALHFAVLDRSDAEGLARDDPGTVLPHRFATRDESRQRRRGDHHRAAVDGVVLRRRRPAAGPAARPGRRPAVPSARFSTAWSWARRPERPSSSRSSAPGARRWRRCARWPTTCAAATSRRRGDLRAEPEHQLHQRLHVPLPLLRLLQRARCRSTCGASPTCSRWRTSSSGWWRRPGAAPPRSACRAASIPTSTASTTCTCSRP